MRPLTIILGAFLLFSVGCVQYHYTPNLIQTPAIEQKGDAMVSASIGGSPVALNGDFHASFSPIKHGALMLNYFRNSSSFENTNFFGGPTYIQGSKGYLLEGALGGYTSMGFGTGALYVGWGQGQMKNDYGANRIADLRLQRFFIQPTFTFKNDWFRLGMGLRLVRLSFPSGDIDYRIEPSDIESIKRLENDTPFWFPEIGGNIGIHFKPVTVTAGAVLLVSQSASDFGFDNSNIGLGLSFELHELFKNKPKKEIKKGRKKKNRGEN